MGDVCHLALRITGGVLGNVYREQVKVRDKVHVLLCFQVDPVPPFQ